MTEIFVRPLRPTFDPVHKDFLPPGGRYVDPTPYWLRRLKYGTVTDKPLQAQVTKTKAKTRKK